MPVNLRAARKSTGSTYIYVLHVNPEPPLYLIKLISFCTILSGYMSIFSSLISRRAAESFLFFVVNATPRCVIFVIYGTYGVAMNLYVHYVPMLNSCVQHIDAVDYDYVSFTCTGPPYSFGKWL